MIYEKLRQTIPNSLTNDDVVFACIGTDRVTGDSLAPYVGMLLEKEGYKNVIGTIDEPLMGTNIPDKIKFFPKNKVIIGIDACIGPNVGKVFVKNKPVLCGKGLGKDLPPIGDYSIKGVMCRDTDNYFGNLLALKAVRLSTVLCMAEEIVQAIKKRFPLN